MDNSVNSGDKGRVFRKFLKEIHKNIKQIGYFIKAVVEDKLSTRDRGMYGENVACEYLRRHGFTIKARNIARKSGEIDILAAKDGVFHVIEVKSLTCTCFPQGREGNLRSPGDNLHPYKLRKVAKTAEWIFTEIGWVGEWQIDAILVWIRKSDRVAKVQFLQHIL